MILYFVKYNFTPVDFCSVKSVVKMQKQKRKKSKEKKRKMILMFIIGPIENMLFNEVEK